MAKDSGTADRSSGQTQRSDTSGPSQTRPAPLARYWHKPSLTPAPHTSKSEPKSLQTPCGPSPDINIFQTPIADNAVMTIELLKTEPSEVFELETSDEDEVIEVALPPKPTITIESSDEESKPVVVEPPPSEGLKPTTSLKTPSEKKKKQKNKRRAESASPVPSVVSSISDDFIRGDCLTFNISRRQEVEKFDFSLHGSDLIEQHSNTLDQSNTSYSPQKSNKKKNKKKKDKNLSPHVMLKPPSAPSTPTSPSSNFVEHKFSTPKSSKHLLIRNYSVSESSIPHADIYESDSNQSAPVDNLPETNAVELSSRVETSISPIEQTAKPLKDNNADAETAKPVQAETRTTIDLTQGAHIIQDPVPVEDSLVMGNVTGFDSVSNIEVFRKNTKSPKNTAHVPQQMLETVTFRSKKTCRNAMDKYYNESWGGEDFDHYVIQMTMPREHTLWVVDSRDRVKSGYIKKRCHYCNQFGHHYDRCHWKPRLCHMCGLEGHYEPRCPNKLCLRCGAPNAIYSAICRNCSTWNRIMCNICKCFGHPVEACPDQWRRYHNTVENDGMLNRQQWRRRPGELFCSGCTRRGHLVHTCRQIPFSNLPLQNPFVFQYSPVFPPDANPNYPTVGPSGRYFSLHEEAAASPALEQVMPTQTDRSPIVSNTRQSNDTQVRIDQTAHVQDQPTQCHFESDVNKRLLSISESSSPARSDKRPATAPVDQTPNKRRSVSSNETTKEEDCAVSSTTSEAAIQDSEVSNTSDVVSTAKIFVEKSAMEELKKPEASEWLSVASAQNRVNAKLEESPTTFVVVSGLPADQEAFQKELRAYLQRSNPQKDAQNDAEGPLEDHSKDIPKNKNEALRMLNAAFSSLQADLGDPKTCYKELKWLQNRHSKMLKEKMISPQQLKHSRKKMNGVLKHLNMILLGQAGLAEGTQCIKELRALHEVLTKFRKNSLPQELRTKFGENYRFVFDPVARDDYQELMRQYYNEPDTGLGTPKAIEALRHKIKSNNLQQQKKRKRKKGQAASSIADAQTSNATPNQQTQSKKKSNPNIQSGNKDHRRIMMNRIRSCQRKLSKIDGQNAGRKNNLINRLSKAYVQVEHVAELNNVRKKVNKLIHTAEFLCR